MIQIDLENLKLTYTQMCQLLPHTADNRPEFDSLLCELEEFNGQYDSGILLTDIQKFSADKNKYPTLFADFNGIKKSVSTLFEMEADLTKNGVLAAFKFEDFFISAIEYMAIEETLTSLGFEQEACRLGTHVFVYGLRMIEILKALPAADVAAALEPRAGEEDINESLADLKHIVAMTPLEYASKLQKQYASVEGCATAEILGRYDPHNIDAIRYDLLKIDYMLVSILRGDYLQ